MKSGHFLHQQLHLAVFAEIAW